MDRLKLEAMSLDELWTLHELVCGLLSTRIMAEKHELERRLLQLNRGKGLRKNALADLIPEAGNQARQRRKYPQVYPKYQNPSAPEETWSGRGKKPRWLVSALKAGSKIEDFRIAVVPRGSSQSRG
jgi:DNA-binding protein H-NS